MLIELRSDKAATLNQFYNAYKGLKSFLPLYATSEISCVDADQSTYHRGSGSLVFSIKREEFLGFVSGLMHNLMDNYQKGSGAWEPSEIIIPHLFYDKAILFIYDGWIE